MLGSEHTEMTVFQSVISPHPTAILPRGLSALRAQVPVAAQTCCVFLVTLSSSERPGLNETLRSLCLFLHSQALPTVFLTIALMVLRTITTLNPKDGQLQKQLHSFPTSLSFQQRQPPGLPGSVHCPGLEGALPTKTGGMIPFKGAKKRDSTSK